jgi:hypothetical protein
MNFPPDESELQKSVVDFREQIEAAMLAAALPNPSFDMGNRPAAEKHIDEPDDFIIWSLYQNQDNRITTTDPSLYKCLLIQAANNTRYGRLSAEPVGSTDILTEAELVRIDKITKHELEHGRVSDCYGNSATMSFYGVEFIKRGDGRITFWPFHFTQGPLKKIHRAWVAVAPEDRSGIDLEIAKHLGYNIDKIVEIGERAQAEPPVDENCHWLTLKESIAKALASSAFTGSN